MDGDTGHVVIDAGGKNTGALDSALVFGAGGTGEGIFSDRNSATNKFGMDIVTAGSRRLSITNTGNVGIGTTSPVSLFDVRGVFSLTNSGGSTRLNATTDANDYGVLTTYGANGTKIVALSSGTNVNTGSVSVSDTSGSTQALMYVDNSNNGVIAADTKSFKVVNPRDNKTDIWYASLEGPEAAMYVRGKGVLSNGRAHVMFPEHFIDMAVLEGMTVQLTANSFDSEGLAYANLTVTGFDVGELHRGRGSYGFDWEVKCVRKDHEGFKVVRPWDAILSVSESREQAWAARMRSIELKRRNRPSGP